MPGPLDGITILDLTIYQNGPWGTVMLSDMGAEIIKIEDPVNGDPGRNLTPAGSGHKRRVNTYFQTMNRNKRSVTLNLKSEQGKAIFFKLVEAVDVVTQNFRVGVVERLGVDFEACRKRNPRIIYASVSGFGSKGPDARDGVYDILGQARGGIMSLLSVNDPGIVYRSAGGLADQMGAFTLAYGVLLAIVARERTGIGQHVEISQLGGQMILQALAINGYLLNGELPMPRADQASNPLFDIYRCGDDRWIALGCIQSDRHWDDVCDVMGLDRLRNDPKFVDHAARLQNCKELKAILGEAFETKGRDEWLGLLKPRAVLCTPVQGYDDLAVDPQVIANEYLTEIDHPTLGKLKQVGVPVKLSETPGAARSAAPEFGEHTEEVLLEHGYSWEEIASFREQAVV
ncbi:MAG: CoA transferase [Chloroflexi bacterium]|nr:CoA transferase [Chloroflexota bacterium]